MLARPIVAIALLVLGCRTPSTRSPTPDRTMPSATTSVSAAPHQDNSAIVELVLSLDRDADMLHADITPSVTALSQRGPTGVLAVLTSLDAPDAMTRLHAQRVFEGVIERAHGFRSGRGFPSADDDASAGAEVRAIGFAHDGAASERRTAIERLRTWTRAQPWQLVAESNTLRVEAGRARYTRGGPVGFCVRVRVTNLGDAPLGLDLREKENTVYANQWGYSRRAWREVIDERRAVRRPLDDADRAALQSAFTSGELTPLPARGATEYLRCIDAPLDMGQPDGAPFFIVALDGEVRASDGVNATQLVIADAWRELALLAPVEAQPLPAGVRAIGP